MFKERIVIILIALLAGLVFSVGAFYLYQKSRNIAPKLTTKQEQPPKDYQPPSTFFLEITTPQDEEVFDKKIVQLTGRTNNFATVVILFEDRETVISPSPDGTFSTNMTLPAGVNVVEIIAITPEGKTLSEKRTFTYTTENL